MSTPHLLLCLSLPHAQPARPPNIVFILADDLGWSDVSWNNPGMETDNLEILARQGVRLDRAYSQQVGVW